VSGAPSLGLVAYTALSIALVLPFAALSWFVIERPALRWKSMVPGARRRPAHAAR
jgi:peptidoglycan/LPS O-acetylase OafA/YrhL